MDGELMHWKSILDLLSNMLPWELYLPRSSPGSGKLKRLPDTVPEAFLTPWIRIKIYSTFFPDH